jgi:excisionase family DNA binding protein
MVQKGKAETFETSTETAINNISDLFFENKIVPEYITTRLAANYLGISENALRIKVCRGQVPVHKLGRSLRFRMAEIASLFQPKE